MTLTIFDQPKILVHFKTLLYRRNLKYIALNPIVRRYTVAFYSLVTKEIALSII